MRRNVYRPHDKRVPPPEYANDIQIGVVVDPMPGSHRLGVRIGNTDRAVRNVLSVAGLDANTGDRVLMVRTDMAQGWVVFANVDTAEAGAAVGAVSPTLGIADNEWQMLVAGAAPYVATWLSQVRTMAELLASHTAMGEAHGLGGEVVIAGCGSMRTAFSTE